MGIPECLPRQTQQGDSESLNPFVLLPSCKYSCQKKVSIRVWVMAVRFWCISLSIVGPKQGQDCKKHKWRIGIGRKGYRYDTERMGKKCHDSCLLSVWIFPKRSVFSLSHCVKRKNLLLVWDSQSEWTSAELFCEVGSLSIAIAYLPQAPCKLLPLMEGIISSFFLFPLLFF